MTSTSVPDPPPGTAPACTVGSRLRVVSWRPSGDVVSTARAGWGTGLREVGEAVGAATRALCSPTGVVGAVVETAWVSTHLALYPFGLLARSEPATGHGYSVAAPAAAAAGAGHRRRGGGRDADPAGPRHGRQPLDLHAAAPRPAPPRVRPGPDHQLLPADGRRPGRRGPARRRRSRSWSPRPATSGSTSSGHSLGGLIARYYVTRLGGDERVHTLVTLGHAARRAPTRAYAAAVPAVPPAAPRQRADARARPSRCRTAGPGSSPTGPTWTRWCSPSATPAWTTPTCRAANVELHGVGHMSLPISGRVVHGISTTLAHLDTDGSTLAAGVTTIAGPAAPGLPRRPS